VREKPPLESIPGLAERQAFVRARVASAGRILLRLLRHGESRARLSSTRTETGSSHRGRPLPAHQGSDRGHDLMSAARRGPTGERGLRPETRARYRSREEAQPLAESFTETWSMIKGVGVDLAQITRLRRAVGDGRALPAPCLHRGGDRLLSGVAAIPSPTSRPASRPRRRNAQGPRHGSEHGGQLARVEVAPAERGPGAVMVLSGRSKAIARAKGASARPALSLPHGDYAMAQALSSGTRRMRAAST